MPRITLTNTSVAVIDMEVYAHHGVLDVEKKVGNMFAVNLTLGYDATRAMESDNIADALNYAVAADIVAREMAIPSQLLEHVANRIVNALVREFGSTIKDGSITITKLAPPLPYRTGGTSFSASFTVSQ